MIDNLLKGAGGQAVRAPQGRLRLQLSAGAGLGQVDKARCDARRPGGRGEAQQQDGD